MNDYNRRPSLRERFARFMMGRYGVDRLYYFLLSLCFILIVINLFLDSTASYVVSVIETALFAFTIYRVLSRNIYKRQQENEKFTQIIEKLKKHFNLLKCKIRDRKTHVYKRCPSCKNNLRLPKQKGEHTVVCPCCKHRFNVKI